MNNTRRDQIKFFFLFLLFSTGCLSYSLTTKRNERLLTSVSLGMTKAQVREILGQPDRARGSIVLKNGQTSEVDEYVLYYEQAGNSTKFLSLGTMTYYMANVYWFNYVDGLLFSWGKPEDWRDDTLKIKQDVSIETK